MILQVDAGNTRIHWRTVDPGVGVKSMVRDRGHVSHGELPDPVGRDSIVAIELACVAGEEVRGALRHELASRSGAPIVEASSARTACGVRNSYADPGCMGVDRWLAMVAAFNDYPGGVIIVDAGTALTVDYVRPDGLHLGGYILPGRQLMLRSLGGDTANVRFRTEGVGPVAPGSSTGECVNNGIGWLWSAVADRLCEDARTHGLGTIVVTGGDADVFTQYLGARGILEEDLVFRGMDRVFADAAFRCG